MNTQSKHTPAPWTVLEVNGQEFIGAKPYDGHPYFGCTTTIEVLGDEDYPTRSADICLCAAAPELLSILEEFEEWNGTSSAASYEDVIKELCPILLKARLAISKARG